MSQAVRRPWLVVAAPSKEANAIVAERRKATADATLPADFVRRRSTDFNPDAQRELMLELAKDPEVVAGARKLMARRELRTPSKEALQTSRERSAEEGDTAGDHSTWSLVMIG